MSIRLMSQVWEKDVSHSEQSILLAMADYAGDDGKNCYPSYERLAWKTGYSERQVARIIKGLCDQGILIVVKEATRHHAPHYWIRISKAKDKPPFRVDILDTEDEIMVDNLTTLDSRDDNDDGLGWTSATLRDDKMSTNPSYNHHHNPPLRKRDDDDDARLRGAVVKSFEEQIGIITPKDGELLNKLIVEYGATNIIRAIGIAKEKGGRTARYVEVILQNEAKDKDKPAHRNSSKRSYQAQPERKSYSMEAYLENEPRVQYSVWST